MTNRLLLIALCLMALGITGLAASVSQKPIASDNSGSHFAAAVLGQNQSEMADATTNYLDVYDLQLVELSSTGLVVIGFGMAIVSGIGITPPTPPPSPASTQKNSS